MRRRPRRSRTPRWTTARSPRPAARGASRRSRRPTRKSSTKSRLETASIEFGATPREAELAAPRTAVGVEVHAGQRARAERQLVGRAEHELEAPRVAPEHPEVRQQVVREVDGLRALEVRVAGHRPSRGGARRAATSTLWSALRARSIVCSACARVNIAMSVATWSLRERAVCSLPPTGPTISVRRRSIAMWMSSSSSRNGNSAVVELLLDPLEAGEDLVAVALGDDPARREHARVRARLLDVVGRQAPVEADRGVQAPRRPGPAAR